VRNSTRILRNAYRRTSPNATSLFQEKSRPEFLSPFEVKLLRSPHTGLPPPIRERSLQRDARASLWLDACLGNFFVRTRFLRTVLARNFRRNVTMRAADECHPLPDQLHPCSRFFRFSSIRALRLEPEPKRSMRFTTPSIASAGDPVFAISRSVRSRSLDVPSPLLFRHPPLRFAPFFRTANVA